ncbi:MAG: CpaF family protein [Candidatus Omnitrophica bacterium]|nr:CpaF family protein [Candidatus Omnitrophota bacterium]
MSKVLKYKIRKKLISEYINLLSRDDLKEHDLRAIIGRLIDEIISHEHISLSDSEKEKVTNEIVNDFLGFGPIDKLLRDPEITEIMVNGPDNVYVERKGNIEFTGITFDDEQHLMYFIQKFLIPTRRRVDESYPYTDVALKDGSRVNIIIPPLALNGPTVTIRKFLRNIKSAEDLIQLGTLDKRMADFLIASIKARINIIFSGATGAGKTTTVNVLSSYISENERIITIEDTAELVLSQRHVVRLETRQPNIEGKGEITIRDLFKNSLRMRPDRIIFGEIRGGEALDMLQAMCSGHRGALCVLHANSPQDVIYRIETMILTSGLSISLEAIHRQIAAAIHLIVQQEQLSDGSRKITHITQINGIKEGEVVLEDIFVYEQEGIDSEGKIRPRWRATGVIPVFYLLFKKEGVDLPLEIFEKG